MANFWNSLPTVSVTPGPTWATMLNAILAQLPTHNHSTVGGEAQIPTAGLNINANLSFNGFNHTAVGAGQFSPGARTLGLQPYGLFVGADGNLYYETSAPNTNAQIQLTTPTGLNVNPVFSSLTVNGNSQLNGTLNVTGGILQGSRTHLGQGQCSAGQLNFTSVVAPVSIIPLGASTSAQLVTTSFIMPYAGSVAAISFRTVGANTATAGTFTAATTGLASNPTAVATFVQMNAGTSIAYPPGTYPISAGQVFGMTITTSGATWSAVTNTAVIVDIWVYA